MSLLKLSLALQREDRIQRYLRVVCCWAIYTDHHVVKVVAHARNVTLSRRRDLKSPVWCSCSCVESTRTSQQLEHRIEIFVTQASKVFYAVLPMSIHCNDLIGTFLRHLHAHQHLEGSNVCGHPFLYPLQYNLNFGGLELTQSQHCLS